MPWDGCERWRVDGKSVSLPWVRLVGGLLLVLAGLWLVVTGPLFHRLWLDIVGFAMLIMGAYVTRLGSKGLTSRPGRHHLSRS